MLTRSIAGNPLDMLIITNLESSQDDIAERPAIILSSRVHPGESNASFIMEGIIDFLMSKDPDACALRDKYVFKIVPMLNPDGVITGNYRCSLGGYDLNRQWLNPTMKASPEIYALKDMIKKTLECRKIELFVDIHGHSRQKNLFIYGCSR
jgi:cytosolic carboxypeptidase protein 2/3|tara:strand:- start:1394 stop:1846 length:453 start_codon:yes stop_codon:yes gene_type:complete